MSTEVQLSLDETLVARAERFGPLEHVIDQALRRSFDVGDMTRFRRWAEDHALLIEAATGARETRS